MSFNLSQRSKDRLKGVHPDLVAVVERAIELTGVDFGVTCGVRTIEEQEANVAAGRSQTMRSKHLPQEDGYSQAVDVVAYVGSEVSWELTCTMISVTLSKLQQKKLGVLSNGEQPGVKEI